MAKKRITVMQLMRKVTKRRAERLKEQQEAQTSDRRWGRGSGIVTIEPSPVGKFGFGWVFTEWDADRGKGRSGHVRAAMSVEGEYVTAHLYMGHLHKDVRKKWHGLGNIPLAYRMIQRHLISIHMALGRKPRMFIRGAVIKTVK